MQVKPRALAEENGQTLAGVAPARRRTRAPWIVLAGAFAYAVLRYVVFGDTAVAQIPLYVTNKAVATGSVIFLLMAGVASVRRDKRASRRWGRWALHNAGIHVVLSLVLLSADSYPKLYGDVLLRFSGEASLLAAALALYCFLTIGKLSESGQRRRALLASVFVCAHLLFYGFSGWTAPSTWIGGLPPISLLTFIVCGGAVGAYAVAIRRR